MNNLYILIPLAVGLICAILGYFLGRLSYTNSENHDNYKSRISELEAEIDSLKTKAPKIETKATTSNKITTSNTTTANTSSTFNAAIAKSVMGKDIISDDLTVIEGIGEKTKELFHFHGINTWKLLSECSVTKCKIVLERGGDMFRIHNPSTWPEQAKLAYENDWSALLKWQNQLQGGKEVQ